jgi:hypothetical protein
MLNSVFGTDRGILFELYNDPKPAPTDANWEIWKKGGSTGADAAPSVGMQTMVTGSVLRAARTSLFWTG